MRAPHAVERKYFIPCSANKNLAAEDSTPYMHVTAKVNKAKDSRTT